MVELLAFSVQHVAIVKFRVVVLIKRGLVLFRFLLEETLVVLDGSLDVLAWSVA